MTDGGPREVGEVLRRVAETLPGGGERRSGQVQMAQAVARSVKLERHLVVQAGTGTGKSLAYLVPLALSDAKTVVATATKNLQDQLADKDLPRLAGALGDRRLRFAVLKGRSNYLCRQRVNELGGTTEEGLGDGDGPASLFELDEDERVAEDEASAHVGEQVRHLVQWAERTGTGDRAELPFEPSRRAWAAVSVTARECPGAFQCPSGPDCFAELARARAAAADVVVVNTHLYAAHVASGGAVLPDHDVVVFDEAHAVEDVMTEGLGLELAPGRLRAAAQGGRGLLLAEEGALADGLLEAADRLDAVLAPLVGRRVLHDGPTGNTPVESTAAHGELRAILDLAAGRVSALASALRRATNRLDAGAHAGGDADAASRRTRAVLSASRLLDDLAELRQLGPDQVAWVEASSPGGRGRMLRAAPVEVGELLAEQLWPKVTAVLTSATVPPLLAARLGLPAQSCDELDVGSPFPYEDNALLYCPSHLPDPRQAGAQEALHDELGALIEAAGGRTLALFTSYRAMDRALGALRPLLRYPLLAQGDLPKAALLEAFAGDEPACLFATMSFWQGVDVPGATLSLVAIDRLPFPRPDHPLLEARRARAGAAAFRMVDLPRAATLLAQGVGRLIRSSSDRGVVAVLDRRLHSAGYGRELRSMLPPMPFTVARERALAFLEAIGSDQ